MVIDTVVFPEPAGTATGEKVAFAPIGSPLTDNVTAAGKVVAPTGATTIAKTASPPGNAVFEAPPPVVAIVRLKSGGVRLTVRLTVPVAAVYSVAMDGVNVTASE